MSRVKRRFYILMTAVFIIAACTTPPLPDGYDWCFTYEFTQDDYGINIQNGEWINGLGIITDESGLLQMNWVEDQTIIPALIIVTVARPDGIIGDVGVQAAGIIFDVAANIDQTLPDSIDEAVLSFEPETTISGSETANITVDAQQEIIIESIEVRGQGFSPFPTNECGPETFTPFPTETVTTPTFTPSSTFTPSITPTPSPTFTPSPTPGTQTLIVTFDGSGYTDYATYSGYGALDSGFGNSLPSMQGVYDRFSGGFYFDAVVVDVNLPAISTVTYVAHDIYKVGLTAGWRWDFYSGANGTGSLLGSGGPSLSNAAGWNNRSYSHAGVAGVRSVRFVTDAGVNNNTQDVWIDNLRIDYNITTTNTPTATFTNTPTSTRTFTPTRTPLASHTPFSGTSTRTPVQIASQTPRATNTLAPSPTPPSFTPAATRTNIASPTRFTTTTAMPTSTGTVTATSEFDEIEEQLEDIEDVNTNILNSIGDFFAWVQGTALNFFDWLAQGFNWILSAFNNLLTFVGNIFQSIWQFIQSILAFFQLIFDIVRLIIEIIIRVIQLVGDWIAQFTSRVTTIIFAFFAAPATPIPGFPTCTSDPTEFEVCALYYILDNTMFSPGTMGQFILPTVLVSLDFWLIYFFARFVLFIVKKAMEAMSV